MNSIAYREILRGIYKEDELTIQEVHNIIAARGGIRKDQWLSISNIISAKYFDGDYKGITSGRSGYKSEYRKDSKWVEARDKWRRCNLLRIAQGDYAIINIASRLFPHDKHDVTVACNRIGDYQKKLLSDLVGYLHVKEIAVIFRGFPARLVENIDTLNQICLNHDVSPIIITTGFTCTQQQAVMLANWVGSSRIINEYGAQDLGIQLYSCPVCRCFHPENPRSLITVVNRVVYATDLFSDNQPVVGSKTGDMATVFNERCPLTKMEIFIPRHAPPIAAAISKRGLGVQSKEVDNSELIVGNNTLSDIVEIVAPSRAQVSIHNRRNTNSICEAISQCLKFGDLQSCRSLLASHLNRDSLDQWGRKKISLINYLMALLIIVSQDAWLRLIASILDNTSTTSLSTLGNLLADSFKDHDETHPCPGLLTTYCLVFEFCLTLVGSSNSKTISVDDTIHDRVISRIVDSSLQVQLQESTIPVLSTIENYVLSYCHRNNRQLLSFYYERFNGVSNPNILRVEHYQSLGFLRKN